MKPLMCIPLVSTGKQAASSWLTVGREVSVRTESALEETASWGTRGKQEGLNEKMEAEEGGFKSYR